jgi:hypothetical protein
VTELEPRGPIVLEPQRPRGATAVERFVAVAAAVRRGTLKVALVGALAAALIGYALLRHGWPDGTGRAAVTIIVLALVVAPPVVLVAFWQLLGELASLPERVRRLPLTGREHAEELGRIVREARTRERGSWLHVPQLIWRLTRLTASSREALTPYAPVLPLLSLPFLALVAVAVAGVAVEVLAALIVALVLLVT